MQLLFLFCTMLIVISEAFSQKLHGVRRSTGFKRKISRFPHRLRYSIGRPKLIDLHIPPGVVPFSCELSQYEAPNFVPLHYYGIKPYEFEKKYFSRKNKANKRLRRQFLEKDSKFLPNSIFKPSQCFEMDQFPRSGFRRFRNFMGLEKFRNSKPYTLKKRRQQCLPYAYVSFNYKNPSFKQRKLIKRLKKKQKRFLNFRKQCLSDMDVDIESSASKTKAANVSAYHEEAKSNLKSVACADEKPVIESQQNFSAYSKSNSVTPVAVTDFTPVNFTTHKFELTDNPNHNDLSLVENDGLISNVRKKEANEIDDESKGPFEDSLADSISKLKHIISDVENAFREEKLKSFLEPGEETDKTEKETKKKVTEKVTTNATADDLKLKEKIDKLAIPVLTQISEDLAKKNKTIASSNDTTATSISSNATSGTQKTKNERCNVDGTWLSGTMKMALTFTMQPNMMIKVTVKPNKESPINGKWSLQGLALSKRGGPYIFAGLSPQEKKVVSFLGQCKISKEEDFIFGIWTLFRFSRKYTDLWKSVETKLDVLTKYE